MLAAALVMLASCHDTGPRPTPDECARLLDRYVEQLLRADRPRPPPPAEVARAQATVRERAANDASFRDCPARVTREQYECAMHASYADALERCMVPIF